MDSYLEDILRIAHNGDRFKDIDTECLEIKAYAVRSLFEFYENF